MLLFFQGGVTMRNSIEIAKYIKMLRERKGISAVELANRVGVTKGTISRYESGTRKIPMDDIPKFAAVLDVSPVDILIESTKETVISYSEYPFLPMAISAGLPLCVDSLNEDAALEFISIPDNIMGKWAGKEIFLMKINGDSMNRVITHGSLIGVKTVKKEELNNGDIVIYSDGGDYAVKRYYQSDDKIIFRPDSTDLSFTDYVTSKDNTDLKIHGKVVIYIVDLD